MKDYKDALCEYVWNSFEANATAVAIDCIPNELTGSAEIVVTDNGDGIAYDSLERTFGAFLDSQKNSRSLQIKTKANTKDDSRVFPLHPWLNGRR